MFTALVMEELFLNLIFNGQELELPVRSYTYGYTYRLEVKVQGQTVIFETDEEGGYRAFASEMFDKNLLSTIAAEFEKLK